MKPQRNASRRNSPVKVIYADGTEEVRAQSSFPKPPVVAHGNNRRARAKRANARNQRALAVSVARDLALLEARKTGTPRNTPKT